MIAFTAARDAASDTSFSFAVNTLKARRLHELASFLDPMLTKSQPSTA